MPGLCRGLRGLQRGPLLPPFHACHWQVGGALARNTLSWLPTSVRSTHLPALNRTHTRPARVHLQTSGRWLPTASSSPPAPWPAACPSPAQMRGPAASGTRRVAAAAWLLSDGCSQTLLTVLHCCCVGLWKRWLLHSGSCNKASGLLHECCGVAAALLRPCGGGTAPAARCLLPAAAAWRPRSCMWCCTPREDFHSAARLRFLALHPECF